MAQILIEKIELHDTLNPKLWENNQLRPEVEEKLDNIVDQFILELQNNDIPIKVLDARLVGSNASFNYTDNSDLDVHIVANFADTSCDVPVLNLLYNYFKKNFNDKYEISIHGVPVELYVEDMDSSSVSNGIYSLYKREWIKFPEPIEVPDIDITDVFIPYEEKYKEIINNLDIEKASDLIDELYLLRKDSISTDGEYGEGNLVFKEFRNRGYLDNLKQLLVDETSKELSLESLNEDKNILNESKYSEIEYLIEEAINRGVKPEDLFEKPYDKEVDAEWFFKTLTAGSSEEYQNQAFTRIMLNNSNNEFYKVLLTYLNSERTGNKNYKKLEPASYIIKDGKIVPTDGRHRAQLCILLDIDLPIKEYNIKNKETDKKYTTIDAVLFHGEGDAPYFTGFDSPEGTYKLKGSKNDFIAYITRSLNMKDLQKELTVKVKPIEDGQYGYFSIARRINNSINTNSLEALEKTIWEPYVSMLMDATYDYYKDLYDIDESFKLTEEDEKGDWGYHYGDLGKADYKHQFGSRNTGGFGTGVYFVGTPISQRKDSGSYKNRPEYKIDFSKYKLFKPRNNEQAYKLHDALLAINNMAPNFKRVPKQWDEVLNEFDKVFNDYYAPLNALDDDDHSTPVTLNKQVLLKYIRKYIDYYPYKLNKDDNLMDIAREIESNLADEAKEFYYTLNNLSSALGYYNEDKLRKIVIDALQDKSDIAPATLIMQKLGYDGVDVRHLNHDDQGLSGLDNFGFGSVIYNLKESIEETGRTVIKAVVFHNENQPKKHVFNFQDFEIDGLYKLGENDYIVFEKRWEEDPRGWGMIHADIIDDFVIPVFPDYRDKYIEEAGLEIDNLQPNSDLYCDLKNLNTKTFSKYINIIRRAIDKYFI